MCREASEKSLVGILKGLEHPNIVKAYKLYTTSRAYYMVLEYLTGGELFDRIMQKESYNERDARDVVKVLVHAVSYLHENSIVHRDLNPGSILLANPERDQGAIATSTTTPPPTPRDTTVTTSGSVIRDNMKVTTSTTKTTTIVTTTPVIPANESSGSLKITDFGKARSVLEGPVRSAWVKSEFSAPEMLMKEAHGPPVDMWSLGLITYILLSGYNPFFHEHEQQMFYRVIKGDCKFKPEVWGNNSPDAKGFVERLLTVDAESRMTAQEAKSHAWLHAAGDSLEAADLRGNLEKFKVSDAKRKLRAFVKTVVAVRRMWDSLQPTKPDLSKYAIVKMLSEGAYAKVFQATRIASGDSAATGTGAAPRYMAVKRIEKEGLTGRETRDVINEATFMRELNHANVVSIYGFYEDDPKYYYMALEFMEGGQLLDRLAKKTYYNEAMARDVCVAFLSAVEYIHSQGIVHRDLQPENLLLASASDDTTVRLGNFRTASSIRDGDLINGCGTPFYVAPEMLKNVPYGTSADMWSVGVTIYVLLAGKPPFYDRDQKKMFRAIKSGNYNFDDEFWQEVSDDAKDLITKLLTVDPTRRMTASEACKHPWLNIDDTNRSSDNLSNRLVKLKFFNAVSKLRAAIKTVMATTKFTQVLEAAPSRLPAQPSARSLWTRMRGAPSVSRREEEVRQNVPVAPPDERMTPHLPGRGHISLVKTFDSSPGTYHAEDLGIRLHVRYGCLWDGQRAGPVSIIPTERYVVACGGISFFVSAVVDCQPPGPFQAPLDLDFRVGEEEEDDGAWSDLDDDDRQEYIQSLRDTHEVLKREEDGGSWTVASDEDVSVFYDKECRAFFIRAKVYHFSQGCLARKLNLQNNSLDVRVSFGRPSKKELEFVNATDRPLMFLVLPTSFSQGAITSIVLGAEIEGVGVNLAFDRALEQAILSAATECQVFSLAPRTRGGAPAAGEECPHAFRCLPKSAGSDARVALVTIDDGTTVSVWFSCIFWERTRYTVLPAQFSAEMNPIGRRQFAPGAFSVVDTAGMSNLNAPISTLSATGSRASTNPALPAAEGGIISSGPHLA
ncbi:unnamed protein product [Ectocarpus fasciculatus]